MAELLFVLPSTTRIVGSFLALVILAWGWAKHKAIGAFTSALSNRATRGFWGYVNKKVKAAEKPDTTATPSNERTYRGRFFPYAQYENPPRDWFFEIENNGTFTKVRVIESNLLSGLNPGALVEIDTRIGFHYGHELVLRVRVSG